MSWYVEVVGTDKDKIKAHLRREMLKPGNQDAELMLPCVEGALDKQPPLDGEWRSKCAYVVKSSGHVGGDGTGAGSFEVRLVQVVA